MGIAQTVTCDLCGKIISRSSKDRNMGEEYQVSVGTTIGGDDTEIDMYKWVCEDCAKKAYDKLMELDW